MMAVARPNGTLRPITFRWLVGLLTASAVVGGFTTSALAWVGLRSQSPDGRMAALEAKDTTLAIRMDSIGRRMDRRVDDLALQLEMVSDMTTMLLTVRCVDATAEAIEAARRARIPCARVLAEQGITP